MVCRIYYAKTWDEALNRAGVEASSELRKLENVFYLEAIRPSALLTHQAEKSKEEAEKARVEAEQAMNVAEQKSYNLGVAETEETLRAEVPVVCRIYCAQTWDEALNRARVEASSELRKAENVFYPSAIRASDPPSTQDEVASITADPNPEVLRQDPPPPS